MSVITLCVLSLSYIAATNGQADFKIMEVLESCNAERREPWSYRGLNGPAFWGLRFLDCYGTQQSPIPLYSANAVKDANLNRLELKNYDKPITGGYITNNGYTIQITPDDGVRRTIFVNGIEYSLVQLHFHWGDAEKNGAEHTLDGIQYAMEMHLVHVSENNQIAPVGIFLQEQDDDNEELQKLVNQFSEVKYKGYVAILQSDLNLNNLLPANPTSYYRYEGSLTLPLCSEGVTWSVVPNPIPIGKAQLKKFQQLYAVTEADATDDCKLVNNHRPLQVLAGREVYVSQ